MVKKNVGGRPKKHLVPLRRYLLGLPPDLFDLVKDLAEEQGKSMHDVLISATRTWALRQKPQTSETKGLQAKIREAKAR
ncbi:MAG: hypothetical protein GY811_14075 [Myxococcales bacterium]|nr:hypothetical protein [Myxococcales bacterium]